MTQILSSICIILIIVIIAAVMIAVCGGLRLPKPEPEQQSRRRSVPKPRPEPRPEPERAPRPRKEQKIGTFTEEPTGRAPMQLSWTLELLDDNDRVMSRYSIPDCPDGGVTLGRSSQNDIHISGYGDMSREHLIISQDKRGVYFEASKACSSTVIVNGKLIYDGHKDTDTGSTKTYLRDGMLIELGSARLRVMYD